MNDDFDVSSQEPKKKTNLTVFIIIAVVAVIAIVVMFQLL